MQGVHFRAFTQLTFLSARQCAVIRHRAVNKRQSPCPQVRWESYKTALSEKERGKLYIEIRKGFSTKAMGEQHSETSDVVSHAACYLGGECSRS